MKHLIAVVVATGLAVGLGAAQQQPQDPQQKPTFRTGVNFVRVDVYPTANGRVVANLEQAEFEVLEDGVPQRIETFERVIVRAPGAEVERAEPRSIAESNEAAADPRNRLFVLFLDSYHSSGDSTTIRSGMGIGSGSGGRASGQPDSRIGRAIAKFLQQLIGPDDLIAVTRPELAMDGLTFTRRPSSFEDMLLRSGQWQRRFAVEDLDDVERQYRACYPDEEAVVANMIARRRERIVLDALVSLTRRLQNLREERKAILVVSEGWTLFKPDRTLGIRRDGSMPGIPGIGVAGGQPVLGDPRTGVSRNVCDRDRMQLAELDNERDFRRMLDDANRANATFYPIDPRGLAVFDGLPGGSVIADAEHLRNRLDSLMTLASATDGIASVNSNDFARSFRRISDDLSTYYLLGYYSSNAKADGRFRKITVRVKRPGIDVRARRGYNAPTEAELASRTMAAAPVDPEARTRETALAALATIRSDRPTHLAAGYRWQASDGGGFRPVIWVAGELDVAAARTADWSGGSEASVSIGLAGGQPLATQTAQVSAASRGFVVRFETPEMKPGEYLVKLRLRGKAPATADSSEQLKLVVPEVAAAAIGVLGQPLLFRRGPFTGPTYQVTADARFRKAERLRVDVPTLGTTDSLTARLLDRKGQPLAIPVTTGQRDDGDLRFTTAELVLAPLAAADYLVEVAARRGDRQEKVVVGFRIIP